MSSQYGELRPTSGWDLLTSLRHPCKFQRVSRLGSVTARYSTSGHQPNFAALNRGRHLYSTGRPSRWALAHISNLFITFSWTRLQVRNLGEFSCVTAKRHRITQRFPFSGLEKVRLTLNPFYSRENSKFNKNRNFWPKSTQVVGSCL